MTTEIPLPDVLSYDLIDWPYHSIPCLEHVYYTTKYSQRHLIRHLLIFQQGYNQVVTIGLSEGDCIVIIIIMASSYHFKNGF